MKKIITLSACVLLLMIFIIPSRVGAQTLSAADIQMQMIKDWERAKAYTISYLNTMPADRYSFKAVDSLRSFANQMLHLAEGNVYIMSNGTDMKTPSWFGAEDIEHSPTAQTKDSVMFFVIASYDYCINAVKNFPLDKWGEKKKMFGFEATRYALMTKAFEHQTHHRGQTTIYIRLVNVRPPQESLF